MGSAECMSLFSLIRWQNSRLDIPSCEPSSDVGAPLWAVITEKYKKKTDSEVTRQDFRKRSCLLNAKSTGHQEIRKGLLFVTRPSSDPLLEQNPLAACFTGISRPLFILPLYTLIV